MLSGLERRWLETPHPPHRRHPKTTNQRVVFFHSISLLKILHLDHFQGPQRGTPERPLDLGFDVCPASEDGRPAVCDGGQDPALDMPAEAAPWHGYTGRSLLNINIFEYIWFIYIYIHVNRYTQKINTIPFYRFQIRRRS